MKRTGGCEWETVKGTYDRQTEHCNKLVIAGSDYCSKHLVMREGKAEEESKKMQKLRSRKEFKKEQRESLKDSPLRGYNHDFDGRATGYER